MDFNKRYPQTEFQSEDMDKIVATIRRFPFATLITQCAEQPCVNQVPLICQVSNQQLTLQGHFGKNNQHWQKMVKVDAIYCVFNGPNHYITPSNYPDEQYPGWNYVAIHIKGIVKLMENGSEQRGLLLSLGKENEEADSSYILREDQDDFDLFIKGIVGFEVKVTDARGIFKLAQNKGASHAKLAKNHLVELLKIDQSTYLDAMLSK